VGVQSVRRFAAEALGLFGNRGDSALRVSGELRADLLVADQGQDRPRLRGLEKREVGPIWRRENEVYIAGRNRSDRAKGVEKQVAAVIAALKADPTLKGIDVHAALCFLDTEWALLDFPFQIGNVWVGALPRRAPEATQEDRCAVPPSDGAHRSQNRPQPSTSVSCTRSPEVHVPCGLEAGVQVISIIRRPTTASQTGLYSPSAHASPGVTAVDAQVQYRPIAFGPGTGHGLDDGS